jgi:hypothetical protein
MPLDKEYFDNILRNVSLYGRTTKEDAVVIPIVGHHARTNLNHIANNASGRLKIYSTIAPKFELILKQPSRLEALSSVEIRCTLCKQVISYPAWYYVRKYDKSEFHYFVCFDSSSPSKPTTRCFVAD